MSIAIFDLDGTLLTNPDRKWEKGEFTWDAFLDEMDNSQPIHSTIELMKWHHAMGHKVVICTARPSWTHERTKQQLAEIADIVIGGLHTNSVIMRPYDLVMTESQRIEQCGDMTEVYQVLREEHAKYRRWACDKYSLKLELETHRKLWPAHKRVVYAYDDQVENLEIWRDELGANIYQVLPDKTISGVEKFTNKGYIFT